LARLAALEQLEFLHLGRTAITDAAIEHLSPLTTLRTLHVTRTGVTEAGAERLRQALPDCEIFSGDPDQTGSAP
jgi:hypothetical protein